MSSVSFIITVITIIIYSGDVIGSLDDSPQCRYCYDPPPLPMITHKSTDPFAPLPQLPDGANSLVVGRLGDRPDPLVLVGGNCALQGFDADGNDPYWNVTGDNIRSMALIDLNQNGQNQVPVGAAWALADPGQGEVLDIKPFPQCQKSVVRNDVLNLIRSLLTPLRS